MSMTRVHVYMPAVNVYKLCWICQVYIYISGCLVVNAQCVGVYVVSVSISAGCECVYIMRICDMRSVYRCIFWHVVV